MVGRRFLTYPGGKGANQAVAAARMGANALMVGRVGDDVFGGQLIEALSASGVNAWGVEVSPYTTSGLAIITIDDTAQNQIVQVLGANDTCGDAEAEKCIQALDDISCVLLQLEVSLEASLKVAQEAHSQGKTVILDPGPVRPLPDEFYSCCSVITPNETEAQALAGFPVTNISAAARAADTLLSRGVGAAIVKLGAQGAYYATGRESGHVPSFEVDAVDSVAAGDAFNGALAVALAEGLEFPEAVRIGCAAGALAVTTSGAQDSMPLRADVYALAGGLA